MRRLALCAIALICMCVVKAHAGTLISPINLGTGSPSSTTALFGDRTYKSVDTTISWASTPSWLVGTISNPTTTPGLTLAPATGLSTYVVVGTDGSGNVGLYSLTTSYLPIESSSSDTSSSHIVTSNDTRLTNRVTSITITVPGYYTVTPSTITTSGTFAITATSGQTANQFLATPNGTTGAVGLRSIAGADLPNPAASTLGGIESLASVSHQWLDSISTSGVPHASQPAFTDISGTATTGQLPTSVNDALYRVVAFQFANGGSTLATGVVNASAVMPCAGTLTAVYLVSPDGTSGSATADIWRTNAGVPTSSSSSIVGGSGTKPSISSTTYGKDTTFTLWTATTFATDDVVTINLTSVTSLKYLTVELVIQTS